MKKCPVQYPLLGFEHNLLKASPLQKPLDPVFASGHSKSKSRIHQLLELLWAVVLVRVWIPSIKIYLFKNVKKNLQEAICSKWNLQVQWASTISWQKSSNSSFCLKSDLFEIAQKVTYLLGYFRIKCFSQNM